LALVADPTEPPTESWGRCVSVVIVNKDDARIDNTLAALIAQDDPSIHEIVVVDSSDHRLDAVRDKHPQARWVDYVHPLGKARTIAEQRNLGVREATGDVIAFLDANCIPSERWASQLLEPMQSDAEMVVVGRVSSSDDSSIHDVGKGQGGLVATYLDECSNMNVAFRREVFAMVGEFNENLGFAEDVDFSWRVRDAGISIYFNPHAVVRHDWGTIHEDIPRAFRYGVGRVRLYRLHRARRGDLLKGDFYITAYAAYTLFLPIALIFPLYLAILVVPLALNRRRRPLRALTYRLVYSLGVLSELGGIPVTKGQRHAAPHL
jgi:mycofactocin glycosyltransferase